MKIAVPCLYSEYGRYTDELRAIPFHLDCLKPVERRVLYALHNVAAKKFVKSALIVGDTIGKYHPHGDQSTYKTLVSLIHRNFATGQGSFGSPALKPVAPAAYRYTEAKVNEIVNQIAFEFVKFVKWGDPENLHFEQPLYLTTPVPLGLIGEGTISGVSFHTTKIPRYTFQDLVNRLINIKKREFDPNVSPYTIIPNIPNFTILEHTPGDFENILSTGKGGIILKPNVTVDNYGVHVWGRPPGGVKNWMKENDVYYIDDLSTKGTFEALFTPKQGVAFDQKFVDYIISVVESKIHFNINVVVDNGTVQLKSIDQLLVASYNTWQNCYLQKLQADKYSFEEKLFQLQVIEVVRDIINKHNINLNSVQDIITIFEKNYQKNNKIMGSGDIKEICSKNNIRTLIEVKIDTKSVKDKIKTVQKLIDDIDNTAFNKMMDYLK